MLSLNEILRKERETLKLSKREVSARMGFSNYQTLSSIESGKRDLRAWELAKLAEIYGRPIDYFLRPTQANQKPRVLWRKLATEETELNERRFLTFCSNYQRLVDLTDESKPAILSLDCLAFDKAELAKKRFAYLNQLAETLADSLGLGSRPACTLPSVLEEKLGVKLLYLDLGERGSGASTRDEWFGAAILVNASDAPWRRSYDLAHEFFHVLTWDVFTDEELFPEGEAKSQVEKWADAFASAILLPEKEMRGEITKRSSNDLIDYLGLVEIAREFSVSIEALLWRLLNLNILDRKGVKDTLDSGEIKDIDKKLRIADWEEAKPYLSGHYIRLAIRALETGLISRARLAQYIGKPLGEVTNFLRKYGYDEDEDYSFEFATT